MAEIHTPRRRNKFLPRPGRQRYRPAEQSVRRGLDEDGDFSEKRAVPSEVLALEEVDRMPITVKDILQ